MKKLLCFITITVIAALIIAAALFVRKTITQKESAALQNRATEMVSSNALLGLSYQEVVAKLGPESRMYESDNQKRVYEWYLGQRKSGTAFFFPYEMYLKVEFENNNAVKAGIISRDAKL